MFIEILCLCVVDSLFCIRFRTDFVCIVHSSLFWEGMVPFPYRMERFGFVCEAVPMMLGRVLQSRTYIWVCRNLLFGEDVSIQRLYIQPHSLAKMNRSDNRLEAAFPVVDYVRWMS